MNTVQGKGDDVQLHQRARRQAVDPRCAVVIVTGTPLARSAAHCTGVEMRKWIFLLIGRFLWKQFRRRGRRVR
ncbi:hypothetical protein [Piscinibacter koreensis]|uniref:Uncharacterized protein n=1 Tax=Piscinibacter koreensis TaxID=2742824 RepID=A0A7Y6TVN1_9BURK|nr:hypothetical protein [Schlegelella koreensis]NUZ05102.1 hypothetical protein [Schlegelella koreensis]